MAIDRQALNPGASVTPRSSVGATKGQALASQSNHVTVLGKNRKRRRLVHGAIPQVLPICFARPLGSKKDKMSISILNQAASGPSSS